MKVSEIVDVLEAIAPARLAKQWDNVGLLVGSASARVRKLMVCIDLTSEVLAEAVAAKARMVLAYHPVIFKGLSRVTAEAAPVVYEAIRRGVAVYSVHTAFDVVDGGTNDVLASTMELTQTRPLEGISGVDQCKIVAYVPPEEMSAVAEAAFDAGAGRLGNYHDCAFACHGIGTFCGEAGTHPSVGEPGEHAAAEEMRLEMIAPMSAVHDVCQAIRKVHSYEMPAIDVFELAGHTDVGGMGRVGTLRRAVSVRTLVTRIKKATSLENVLIARPAGAPQPVKTAACGAGSCGKLFRAAVRAGATFYLTGEMRHHDLLAATAAGMTVVCLGHSNSERIAIHSLGGRLSRLLTNVSVVRAGRDKDPLEVV